MARKPSNDQLALVAEHGSGPLERALAIVLLAKRQNRMNELQQLIKKIGPD